MVTASITEKFSKKRGRPKEVNTDLLGALYPEIETQRGLSNIYYHLRAFAILQDMEKYGNFFHDKKKGRVKKTILSELGRIAVGTSPVEMLACADIIYEQRMSTREAVSYLRKVRGFGKDKVEGVIRGVISIINSSYLSEDELTQVIERLRHFCIEQED